MKLPELRSTTKADLEAVMLDRRKKEVRRDLQKIVEAEYTQNEFKVTLRPVRPIPDDDSFFENVWRGYRENKNVY